MEDAVGGYPWIISYKVMEQRNTSIAKLKMGDARLDLCGRPNTVRQGIRSLESGWKLQQWTRGPIEEARSEEK